MGDYTVERFEVDGLTVRIEQDDDASHCDPRDNDNVGTMICWHPNYILGDVQIVDGHGRGAIGEKSARCVSMLTPDEAPQYRKVKSEHEESGRFKSLEHLRRYLSLVEGAKCVLPLYLYDHSGISMSVGCAGDNPFDRAGWDSSNVGFIYATEERIEALCGAGDEYRTVEFLDKALRSEVEEYNYWLTGQVYGFIVEDASGEHLDSCWGFIGSVDYCKEQATEAAKGVAAERKQAAADFQVAHALAWARAFAGPSGGSPALAS